MKKLLVFLTLALAASVTFAEDAYLESDGTQYIVTGYHPTEKMKLVCDFQIKEIKAGRSILGNKEENGSGASFSLWMNNGNPPICEGCFVSEANASIWTGRLKNEIDTSRSTIEIDYAAGKFALLTHEGKPFDGYSPRTPAGERRKGTGSRPLSFFTSTPALANADTAGAAMKLYSAQVYEDGELIHDYVPCKKGDRIGLYDMKTCEFWGSVTRELAIGGNYLTLDDDPYVSCSDNNISSGTKAIIDTNYKPNAKTRIELDYALSAYYTEGWTGDWALLMAHTATGKNEDGLISVYQNASTFGVSMDEERWQGLGTFGRPTDYSKDIRRMLVMDIAQKKTSVLVSGYLSGGYAMTGEWTADRVYKSLKIGGYDGGTGGCAPMKIYGLKIYEDDVLIHDYAPAKIGDEGFLKDSVTGLTLTPMNPQYPFAASENAEALPYVESTGNQIVVLDYKPNAKSVIEVDTDGLVRVKDTNIFGVSDNSGSCQFHVNSSADDKGPGMEAYMHSVWGWRMVTGLEKFGQRVKFMLDVPKSYAYARKADGTNLGSTNFAKDHAGYVADVDEATLPMALFNVNKSSVSLSEGAKVKIYSAKVWEDGELLHSYQPYVKDGVVGFKDMVTGSFFEGLRKSGATTQVDLLKIGGGAVKIEGDEPEAYIESDQTQYIKTDVYPSALMRLEIDFQLTKIHNDFYLLGSNATPYWDLYVNGNYGFTTICHTDWSTKTTDNYWATMERTKVVMDRKAGTWSITRATDAKSGTYGAADTTTSTVPFGIFARQEAEGTPNWPHYPKSTTTATGGMTPMRIYSIRIYENEELAHEFLPYKNGDVTGLKDTRTGRVYTSDEGNPLVIGGKGYDGTKTFATALAGDTKVAPGESVTFGPVFAPGAIRYEWTRGGVPLAETVDKVTLDWERVKGDHTQEISVTPVYSVYGQEVKGEPSTAMLMNEPFGMAIIIR